MKTNIETKTNSIQSWIESKNTLDINRDLFNKSLLTIVEKGEIVDKKWSERKEIATKTKENLAPLIDNTHSLVESELAKMFWLNWLKVSKLQEDFREPMTLSSVLNDAEWYWDSHDIVKAA